VNGAAVGREPRQLVAGDLIEIAGERLEFLHAG
jgi:ribosome-associated protein YbcJ (S4-like RNA binding protein)